MSDSEKTSLVEMRHISKKFGDVQALDDVSFSLERGEVHALLGENGAGKTTLMNVLSGLYMANEGEIDIDGKSVAITCPRDSLAHGVNMVHQHFELIPHFTVLENIILGHEGDKFVIDVKTQRKYVEELMKRYSLTIELDKKIVDLPVGVQQKVEILKALYRGASILILDEPTTMLTPQEVDALFAMISNLTKEGMAVVLITHKIREVLANCTRITVMRRGRLVKTVPTADASEASLVRLMIGDEKSQGEAHALVRKPQPEKRQVMFETKNITVVDEHGNTLVNDISMHLDGGEIVGLVAVAGNGQREIAEAVYGMRHVKSGSVFLNGVDVTTKTIQERLKGGLANIPEDRMAQGILPHCSLAETLILGSHTFMFKKASYDVQRANKLARDAIRDYKILAPDEKVNTGRLSGGNIQKVVIAKAFLLDELVGLKAVIAFNPTRGLDVMSTRFIHEKLMELRNTGRGVLLISEDLDESLSLCDRIYIIFKGSVVGAFPREEYDPYRIGALMVGGGN
ncbi:MAG TPA: ABC transporter ATP-binding protein [Anaerolineaceae bacterium]|nr:ABC transporter ATP-binding protein [Anaerolineaceae bacterium]